MKVKHAVVNQDGIQLGVIGRWEDQGLPIPSYEISDIAISVGLVEITDLLCEKKIEAIMEKALRKELDGKVMIENE